MANESALATATFAFLLGLGIGESLSALRVLSVLAVLSVLWLLTVLRGKLGAFDDVFGLVLDGPHSFGGDFKDLGQDPLEGDLDIGGLFGASFHEGDV